MYSFGFNMKCTHLFRWTVPWLVYATAVLHFYLSGIYLVWTALSYGFTNRSDAHPPTKCIPLFRYEMYTFGSEWNVHMWFSVLGMVSRRQLLALLHVSCPQNTQFWDSLCHVLTNRGGRIGRALDSRKGRSGFRFLVDSNKWLIQGFLALLWALLG